MLDIKALLWYNIYKDVQREDATTKPTCTEFFVEFCKKYFTLSTFCSIIIL